jgi:AcrR family transcriptional regulator
MARQNNRESILDAAEEVVVSHGTARLTLDAVAETANVSKGGLLYHFPTKEALLAGMIERMIARFHERRAEAATIAPECPARNLYSLLATQCHSDHRMRKIGSAILAATANDPHVTAPFRERFRVDMRVMFEGLEDFPSAAILFLASEGMAKLDLLDLNPFTNEEREQIRAELLRRVQDLR